MTFSLRLSWYSIQSILPSACCSLLVPEEAKQLYVSFFGNGTLQNWVCKLCNLLYWKPSTCCLQLLLQVFFPFTLGFLSICLLRNLVAAVDSFLLLHIQCSHISLTLKLNYVSNCISFNTFLPICTGQWSLLFLMINYDITIRLKSNQKSFSGHSPWWSPFLVLSFSGEFYFPPLYSEL